MQRSWKQQYSNCNKKSIPFQQDASQNPQQQNRESQTELQIIYYLLDLLADCHHRVYFDFPQVVAVSD